MALVTWFHHEAVFYAGDEQYLAGTIPRLRATVAAGGAAMVAVRASKTRLLREALGADGGGVTFVDMAALGRNPNRIIPAWREFMAEHGGGERPVLGIGEPIWPGRGPAELVECDRHESLLNLAFRSGPEWLLLCPYDVQGLTPEVLEGARRNHPHVSEAGVSRRSGSYRPQPPPLDAALPSPAAPPAELSFGRDDLDLVRMFVGDRARREGLPRERLRDLVLAIHELATNSMRHGGGSGTLRLWLENGCVLCEVRDRGRIDDPLAGRSIPVQLRPDGRGLWLVNQLCDLVQLRSSSAGTAVRVHMTL